MGMSAGPSGGIKTEIKIVEGNENLRPLGVKFLWEGAQEIVFSEA